MIPILYAASETDFTTNGIGLLTDAVSCTVTEERNGAYEATLVYPAKGHLAEYIAEDAIIKAKANDTDEPQLFRIYKSGKQIGSNTTWNAEHISYELTGNPVEQFNVSGVNAEQALNRLLAAAVFKHKYTATSDITTVNSTSIADVVSVRKALGGVEGSILDTWGGEYHFNNYRIELLKARGADNGVTIEYGKNLTDAKQERNISNIVTAIFPYAKYTPEGTENEVFVSLKEKTLVHADAANYAYKRCEIVDFSSEWESGTIITEDMLRAKAEAYLEKISTEPDINITLSYAQLKKTKDYKNIQAMESVKLCDTVTVRIDKLQIEATAKIVKAKYDSLKERYDTMEIGSVRTNLTKQLTATQQEITESIKRSQTRAEQIKKQIEQTIVDVTAAITGNSGGYVVLYPEKNPQEIYILDQPELSKAKNVWRWNLAGLGHSNTGANGKFTTAITADGQIVADFITAGELTGSILRAGTVYAEALDVEYRNAVTKHADDAANKAYEDSLSKIQTTAEELKLLCKKISETAMHNYAADFTDDLSAPWYASSTNNVVESSTTLGRYAKIVKASANYNSYIRCDTKKTPAGTYRVRYKAATIAGQESTARVQCSFKTTATTAAGALKSDDWTTFERDIELSSDYDGYIYFYATVSGTTVLIKDVEVLGLLRDYAEAQFTVNADNITAEVKRAQDAEKELKASIKVNAEKIETKVTADDVSSQIEQSAESIRCQAKKISWKSDSSEMTEDGLLTCKGASIEDGNIICQSDKKNPRITLINNKVQMYASAYNLSGKNEDGINTLTIGNSESGFVTCYSKGGYTERKYGNLGFGGVSTTDGDKYSNLSPDGLWCTGSKHRVVRTQDYGERLLCCYETPSPMFGDVGAAQIDETGKCLIFIDEKFAQTVDLEYLYDVFLTKYGPGDCYVSERTASYFIVEGAKNLKFAWEIKTIQRDYENLRLEEHERENDDTDYIYDVSAYMSTLLYQLD
nr:MAG TPA: tail protein [Caudoviricetes sp.]